MKHKWKLNRVTLLAMAPLLCLVLTGCAHDTKKDAKIDDPAVIASSKADEGSASIEAKMVAAEDGVSDVTEIKFLPKSSDLRSTDAEKIEKTVTSIEKKKRIRNAVIVVWSDSEAPEGRPGELQESLPKAAIELADQRAKAISTELMKSRPHLHTEVVNTAKQPSNFKKFFKTKDVRLLQTLKSMGTNEKEAGHAMLIFETE